jgi:uncharacterized protein (TIGR02117 family)
VGVIALAGASVLVIAALAWRTPGNAGLFPPRPGEEAVTIYVVDNGFHTDLVLPRAALQAQGGAAAQALARIAPGPWVAVGWGDRRFYVQQRMSLFRLLDGVRALFWPANPSTVQFVPLQMSPDRIWRSGVLAVQLSPRGFASLARRLDRSFTLYGGAPRALPTPGENGGLFFESRERFGALHLCNHWTAQLLNASGLAMRPRLDALPAGVILDLEADRAVVHTHSK